MTRAETIQLLAILRAAYPAFYKGMGKQELESIVNLWTEMFPEPAEVVAAAVKLLIANDTKGYPPHIGAIKERIHQINTQGGMSEAEAWALVRDAAANGAYGAESEFEALPPLLQKLVGGPDQLRQWAMMDEDTVSSVIASNFQRAYRGAVESEKQWAKAPDDVKVFAKQLAESLSLREADTALIGPKE